jgi:hypothetical protein
MTSHIPSIPPAPHAAITPFSIKKGREYSRPAIKTKRPWATLAAHGLLLNLSGAPNHLCGYATPNFSFLLSYVPASLHSLRLLFYNTIVIVHLVSRLFLRFHYVYYLLCLYHNVQYNIHLRYCKHSYSFIIIGPSIRLSVSILVLARKKG